MRLGQDYRVRPYLKKQKRSRKRIMQRVRDRKAT